jgi:hypothetical protein
MKLHLHIKQALLLWFLIGLSYATLAQRFPYEALQGKWNLSETKIITEGDPRVVLKTPSSGYQLYFNKDSLTTTQKVYDWTTGKTSINKASYSYTFKKKGYDAILTLTPLDPARQEKKITISRFNSFELQTYEEFEGSDSSIFNPSNFTIYTFDRDTNSINYSMLENLNNERYYNQSPYADSVLNGYKVMLHDKKNYLLSTEQNQVIFFPDTVITTLRFDTSSVRISSRSYEGVKRPKYENNNDFYRKGSFSDRHDINYQLFYFYPNRKSIEICSLDDKSMLYKYKISKSKLTLLPQ